MLGEKDVAFAQVSQDIQSVKSALQTSIPLSAKAEASLEKVSKKTQKYAKRLRFLPERLQHATITAPTLRKALKKHHIDPTSILVNNEFSFEERDVGVFFDAIESRYFKDEFSSEERKADRYSTRS